MTGLKKGISGGQKHMFLVKNRDLVMQYHQKYGDEKTCEYFNITGETLFRLINNPGSYNAPNLPAVMKNDFSKNLTRADVQRDIEIADYEFLQDKPKSINNDNKIKLNFTLDLTQSEAADMLSSWLKKSRH